MKEINEAYDTIVSQRKNRGANNNGYGYNNYNTYNAGYNAGYAGGSSASGFNDVRRFIMAGRIARRGADLKPGVRWKAVTPNGIS